MEVQIGSAEKFADDMQIGEAFEFELMDALQLAYPTMYWQKHNNCSGEQWHCKCYDLEDLSERSATVECKRDGKSLHTGNLCFETYLMKPDVLKAEYWAHRPFNNTVLWFRVEDLRRAITMLQSNGYITPLWGGDGNRTEMYVIDGKLFLKNCPHRRFELNNPLPTTLFV